MYILIYKYKDQNGTCSRMIISAYTVYYAFWERQVVMHAGTKDTSIIGVLEPLFSLVSAYTYKMKFVIPIRFANLILVNGDFNIL